MDLVSKYGGKRAGNGCKRHDQKFWVKNTFYTFFPFVPRLLFQRKRSSMVRLGTWGPLSTPCPLARLYPLSDIRYISATSIELTRLSMWVCLPDQARGVQ